MAQLPTSMCGLYSVDEDQGCLTTSSSTVDSSAEDIKPDLTLLGQRVSALEQPLEDLEDSCEDDPFSPQPGGAGGEPDKKSEKKSKKGSKRGGMKGLKQGTAGDDSFTITTLSAGRGQNKLQAAHLTSSLLEEVLNEKKMALLKSPEVIEQLQCLQEGLRTNQQQQTQPKPSPSRPESKTRGHLDREARSSRHTAHPETPGVRHASGSTSGGAGSGSSIWSKEASAFTSVASTSTSGSNMET